MHKIKKFQQGTWGGGFSPTLPPQNGGSSFISNTFPQQLLLNSLNSFQKAQIMPKTAGIPTNMLTPSTAPKTLTTPTSSITKGTTKTQGTSFMDTKLDKGLGAVGGMLGSIYDAIPTADKVHNENDDTMANIRGTANKALLSGIAGPWGMAAGAASMLIDKTGGFTDASKGLGGANDTLNSIASLAIPGAGWFTKKTIDYKMSDALKSSAGYTGTASKGNTAQQNAGTKILFGRGKATDMIAKAKIQDNMVQDISDKAQTDFAASNNPLLGFGTQLQLAGGYQQGNIRTGKSGLKIDREFAQRVINQSKSKEKEDRSVRLEEVVEFKNGGAVNVIPNGALHAHKHHLGAVDDKFEEVTGKGIPVITEENGGDITQHAEVEKDEIIFNLDVTKQFEKLKEDGSDDAAIEAGKMLVHEILNNTVDNTGLLNKVE